MPKKQKKLRKKKKSHVIELSGSIKIRTVPAVIAFIVLAVVCAFLVAGVFALYTFLVGKSSAVGVAVPVILYILLVTVSSYVAANYFNIRSFVPSATVGGLFLLMSLTYTISAYGFKELAGATVPLKLLFTIIGVFLGYFLVDIINLPWLPVREQDDSYFMDDEYDDYAADLQNNQFEQSNQANQDNTAGGFEQNFYGQGYSNQNFSGNNSNYGGSDYGNAYGSSDNYGGGYSGFHQYNGGQDENSGNNNGY